MKPWNSTAYLAVVVTAIACAAIQPEEASAVEQHASRLDLGLWTADAAPTQQPATVPAARPASCPACKVSP